MTTTTALAFELPAALEATEPPEARGSARDAVRLMVADAQADHITHAAFTELAEFLTAGDLVVVNVSQTLPAALAATRADGTAVRVHWWSCAPPTAPTRCEATRGRRSRSPDRAPADPS